MKLQKVFAAVLLVFTLIAISVLQLGTPRRGMQADDYPTPTPTSGAGTNGQGGGGSTGG